MLDDHTEESHLWDGHMLLRAHDIIWVGDATHIFHCTILVIWAHHVVNFAERISSAKVLLVKVKSSLSDAENVLVAQVLNKWLSDEDSLRHIHRIKVLKDFIRTSTDGIQVCWNARSCLELIDCNYIIMAIELEEPINSMSLQYVNTSFVNTRIVVSFLYWVWDSAPILWASYNKTHLRLQVGLVKTWEDTEAMECFELWVKILTLVLQVSESVKSNSVFIVGWKIAKLNSVPALDDIFLL